VNDPNQLGIIQLLSIGLRGCLPLRLLPDQIVEAVELIVQGGYALPAPLGWHFFAGKQTVGEPKRLQLLTRREQEALALALMGFGFAKWSNTVKVNANVQTGNINVGIRDA
jgi:DNA-binding NarL/FixJ family response regulator